MDLVNAVPVHGKDLELPAFEGKLVTGNRDAMELREYESTNGCEANVFAWNFAKFEHLQKIRDRKAAIDEPGVIALLCQPGAHGLAGAAEVAHNRLHEVGERHHSIDTAMFVHDERHLLAGFLETFQHFEGGCGFRDDERFVGEGSEIDRSAGLHRQKQILHVNDPDNSIEVSLDDGEPGMRVAFQDFAVSFPGIFHIQKDHPAPRVHEVHDASIAEPEDPFHHLLFGFLEGAVLGALGDENLDFVFCDGRFVGLFKGQHLHYDLGREGQELHRR